MAVIQEYYSSRFDLGKPALTSFLAGFMETRRELNMMRIKAELASADPRSLMALQKAALQQIADLNKLKGQIAAADQKQRNDITVELIRAGSRERVAEIGAESRVAAARVSAKANLIRSARAAATYANKQTEEGIGAGNTQAGAAEKAAGDPYATVEDAVTKITSAVDSGMEKLGGTRMSPRTREAAQFAIASRAYNAAKAAGQDSLALRALRDRFFQGKEPEAYAADAFRVESEEEIQDRLGNVQLGGLSRARLESGQPLSAAEQRALIRGSKLPDGRTVEQAIGGASVVESTPDEVLTTAAAEEAPGAALPAGAGVSAGAGTDAIEDAIKKAEARYAALEKRALQGKGLTEVLFDRANPLYGLPGRRPRAVREAAIEEVVAEEAPPSPAPAVPAASTTPATAATAAAEETTAVVASMPETPIKSKGMVLPEPAGVPEEAPALGAYARKTPLPETGVRGTAGISYTGELDTGDRVLGAKTPRPARFEIPRFAAPDARRPTTDEELLRDAAEVEARRRSKQEAYRDSSLARREMTASTLSPLEREMFVDKYGMTPEEAPSMADMEAAAAKKAARDALRARIAFAEKQRATFPVGQQLARFGEALGGDEEMFGSAAGQIQVEPASEEDLVMASMPVRRK